jgi:hypothetical protein
MHLADTYALATLLPVLALDFEVSPIRLKYALTVYLLISAAMIPVSGWLADRWGPRRIFLLSIALFLTGSICCAFSRDALELTFARALQGLGGGVMVPVARLIVVRSSTKVELVKTLNWFTVPAIMGPLLGPTIAGYLAEYSSWRFAFLMNLPIGLIGALLVVRYVPSHMLPPPGRVDFLGVVLVGSSILGVMILADAGGSGLLSGTVFFALLTLTLCCVLVSIRHLRRVENPVLDLSLVGFASFRAALIGGGLLRLSLGATPFLLPIMLQTAFGWPPSSAGLVLLWAATGAILGRLFSVRLIEYIGFRNLLIISGFMAAIFVMVPGLYVMTTPKILIFSVAIVTNFLFTAHYAASNALIFADIPEGLINAASTLSVVAQQITQSLGISLAALVLHLSVQDSGGEIMTSSFLMPFLVLGSAGLLALPLYLSLSRDAAQNMTVGGR